MKDAQRKYAMERIAALERAALSKITDKHVIPPKTLSTDEMLDLVHRKKVNLRKHDAGYHLRKAFDFSGHEHENRFSDEKKYKSECMKAKAAFTKVRDELVLGDSVQALEAIRALESEWVS